MSSFRPLQVYDPATNGSYSDARVTTAPDERVQMFGGISKKFPGLPAFIGTVPIREGR